MSVGKEDEGLPPAQPSGDAAPAVPEELVRFVQVLAEDDDLRAWFESFDAVPDPVRQREFHELAARMQAAGEDGELVRATVLLGHPGVYRGVRCALAERT